MKTFYRIESKRNGQTIANDHTDDLSLAEQWFKKITNPEYQHGDTPKPDKIILWQDLLAAHDCYSQIVTKWQSPNPLTNDNAMEKSEVSEPLTSIIPIRNMQQ